MWSALFFVAHLSRGVPAGSGETGGANTFKVELVSPRAHKFNLERFLPRFANARHKALGRERIVDAYRIYWGREAALVSVQRPLWGLPRGCPDFAMLL